jgi:hypothetical protein
MRILRFQDVRTAPKFPELKNKNYKMSGIVLENDEVLEAMEKNVQGILYSSEKEQRKPLQNTQSLLRTSS